MDVFWSIYWERVIDGAGKCWPGVAMIANPGVCWFFFFFRNEGLQELEERNATPGVNAGTHCGFK